MAKLNSWRNPYYVRMTPAKQRQPGYVSFDLHMRLRWWHPRLWWQVAKAIRKPWVVE